MEPPRRPNNDVPRNQKQHTRDVLDDKTLMVFVSFLYAFYQVVSLMNAPQCTC